MPAQKVCFCCCLCLFAASAWGDFRVTVVDVEGKPAPDVVVLAPSVKSERPPARVTIDQRDMQFVPHVIVAPLGEPVHFPNSDKTRHQVYSFSAPNNFELKLYRQQDAPPVSFASEGVVELGCNIHDSMKGYIFVTRVSSHGVTNAQGLVSLPGVVNYPTELQIWYPALGSKSPKAVELQADGVLTLDHAVQASVVNKPSSLRDRLQRFKRQND
ncbi:methylamine utilization protein [Simiduia aestuariiviva]|uniref:Plastocyanin n=1 Tax=Simiduia aestuariiviva TaxID=1510459 RepID=A0A839UU72_9GAMM|nr:methylamine utilization protein [Simiduia aestuariiviva]MBB3169979.1 plastocyanin [Simiduia aestuariiviva]